MWVSGRDLKGAFAAGANGHIQIPVPLSSELGTTKAVKARFWTWLSEANH